MRLIYSKFGQDVPDEPPTDPITEHVIGVFMAASRGRRYLAGHGAAVPLRLSTSDITPVVQAYGSPLPRSLLDACVFSLDQVFMEA